MALSSLASEKWILPPPDRALLGRNITAKGDSMVAQCRRSVTLGDITNGNCPTALKSLDAGYVEEGIFYTDCSVARHFYQEYKASLATHNTEVSGEALFRDRVAGELKRAGWQVAREQYTSQGRIDVLAVRDSETRIIETKLAAGSNDMAHALGQLMFYSKFYPGASLWVASPEKPDPTILSILVSYQVRYLEVTE